MTEQLGYVAEIEQEVFAAIFMGAPVPVALTILSEKHFVHVAHQKLFAACIAAHEAAGTAKSSMVLRYVDTAEMTKLLGMEPKAYAAGLMADSVFGRARFEEACRKVVAQWARLAFANTFAELAEIANDPASLASSIARDAGERIEDIVAELRAGGNRRTRFDIHDAAQEALTSASEARERGGGLAGVTWGLEPCNRVTGGIQKRDLTLMAARPSMGKTTVAMSCALKAAMKGFCIGFVSLEMDAQKVAARCLSDIAFEQNIRVPYADIIRGNIDDKQEEALYIASERLKELPLYIEDQASLTLHDIRVKLESLAQQASKAGHELDGVIVDHIGLIKPPSKYAGNRNNEMAEISATLKNYAREYDVFVLALSQLSRASQHRKDKRPILTDLRDSGALEQDADTVIFLHREAYYLERESDDMDEFERQAKLEECRREIEFIIAKQRNGPITTIKLFGDMAFSAIRSAA